jgi:hypothetical protein
MRTTVIRNTPRITLCQYAESKIKPQPFSKLSTLKITPNRSAPVSFVITEPDRPVIGAPPTTTKAIA